MFRSPFRCLVLDFFLQGDLPRSEIYSVWHGAFGKALAQVSPDLFDKLFGVAENLARLYVLTPPLRGYPRFRVTLMGDACDAGREITETVKVMGLNGLGKERCRFTIDWAQYGLHQPLSYYHGVNDEIIRVPEPRCITTSFIDQDRGYRNRLRFSTVTPLILKEGNGLMVTPPTFPVLVRRFLGRISQVAHASGAELPYADERQRQWLSLAGSVGLVNQRGCIVSFSRLSKRTGHRMVFNGWDGTLEYAGPLSCFYGLFKLGEKLQLGGRTAFGFGAFQTLWGNIPDTSHETVEDECLIGVAEGGD